jgi:hypothetical protein
MQNQMNYTQYWYYHYQQQNPMIRHQDQYAAPHSSLVFIPKILPLYNRSSKPDHLCPLPPLRPDRPDLAW